MARCDRHVLGRTLVNKQLLDEVFVISRIIKVVGVIRRRELKETEKGYLLV